VEFTLVVLDLYVEGSTHKAGCDRVAPWMVG
jgi:hypothetical protein